MEVPGSRACQTVCQRAKAYGSHVRPWQFLNACPSPATGVVKEVLCGRRLSAGLLSAASVPSFLSASFLWAGLDPGRPTRGRARRCLRGGGQASTRAWFERILGLLRLVESLTLEEVGRLPARQELTRRNGTAGFEKRSGARV